jgi:hypothetical protein
MPRNPEARGACAFCGEEITKRSVAKHIAVCLKYQQTLPTSDQLARHGAQRWPNLCP